MPPNLLAHYPYLWEPTVVRQAVETARISASVRRTFIQLLVPAGSSSWCTRFGRAPEPGAGDPQRSRAVELGGIRTYVVVALRKDGQLLGAIAAYHCPGPGCGGMIEDYYDFP